MTVKELIARLQRLPAVCADAEVLLPPFGEINSPLPATCKEIVTWPINSKLYILLTGETS